jgi:hypothetical protein
MCFLHEKLEEWNGYNNKGKVMVDTVGTCPRCEEHTMMTPPEVNALSRTTRGVSDTPMWVCSDCGMDEGLEDAFHTGATEQINWPMERTFQYFITQTNIQTAQLMNEVDNEA